MTAALGRNHAGSAGGNIWEFAAEQRYRAVLDAAAGIPVSVVASAMGRRVRACMRGSAGLSRAV